ncbi:MAG: cyclic nucleotide-binding domain-containing protein [Myxococcota bacterium]|nr:cyclic nucleotide-binding domain-containing protein [Myxococcota bacterium]
MSTENTDPNDSFLREIRNFRLQYQDLLEQFFNVLPNRSTPRIISPNESLSVLSQTTYLWLRSGKIKQLSNKTELRYFGPGDLLKCCPASSGSVFELQDDVPCHAEEYSESDLMEQVMAHESLTRLWIDIQDAETRLLEMLCGYLVTPHSHIDSSFKYFNEGDVIIREGDKPDGIYEMVSGKATVCIGGTAVGEISANEIFGEISYLTDSPRSATITALSTSLVQISSADSFDALVEHRSDLLANISSKLAYRLVATNQKVEEVKVQVPATKKVMKIRVKRLSRI